MTALQNMQTAHQATGYAVTADDSREVTRPDAEMITWGVEFLILFLAQLNNYDIIRIFQEAGLWTERLAKQIQRIYSGLFTV